MGRKNSNEPPSCKEPPRALSGALHSVGYSPSSLPRCFVSLYMRPVSTSSFVWLLTSTISDQGISAIQIQSTDICALKDDRKNLALCLLHASLKIFKNIKYILKNTYKTYVIYRIIIQ